MAAITAISTTAAPQTSTRVRRHVHETADHFGLQRQMRKGVSRLLAGHVPVCSYAPLFPSSRILSFVRQPVEQVASHHAHLVRMQGYQDDLLAFSEQEQGAGLQSWMLAGVPLEAMGVVGVTERQAQSIQVINAAHQLDLKAVQLNRNPQKTAGEPYVLTPAERAQLEARSVADQALYRRANRLLDARLRALERSEPFINGAITRIHAGRVEGFAFQAEMNTAVRVRLHVDGRVVYVARSTAYMERLALLNVPRKGYVGFSLPLPDVVGDAASIKVQVAETGQALPRL